MNPNISRFETYSCSLTTNGYQKNTVSWPFNSSCQKVGEALFEAGILENEVRKAGRREGDTWLRYEIDRDFQAKISLRLCTD